MATRATLARGTACYPWPRVTAVVEVSAEKSSPMESVCNGGVEDEEVVDDQC